MVRTEPRRQVLLVLHKLHMVVLEDHKGDPKKEKLIAKAFEVLGIQAVKNEMSKS